jgi:hypothetical protein
LVLVPDVDRGLAASGAGSTVAGGAAAGGRASAVAGVAVAAGGAASATGRGSAAGVIAFNDAICDFKTSVLKPSRFWITIRSGFTSTSLPDTLAPSLFATVTSVPRGYVSVFVQLARAMAAASRIGRCFITPPVGTTWAVQVMCLATSLVPRVNVAFERPPVSASVQAFRRAV